MAEICNLEIRDILCFSLFHPAHPSVGLVGLAHQIQNHKHRVQPLWIPARAGGPVRWDEREVGPLISHIGFNSSCLFRSEL